MWTQQNTRLDTWFERDRAYVILYDLSDNVVLQWWDAAVAEAVEDGFLDPADYHGSAAEYANHLGIAPQASAPKAPRSRTL